jgi:hypothetical protein
LKKICQNIIFLGHVRISKRFRRCFFRNRYFNKQSTK